MTGYQRRRFDTVRTGNTVTIYRYLSCKIALLLVVSVYTLTIYIVCMNCNMLNISYNHIFCIFYLFTDSIVAHRIKLTVSCRMKRK